MNCSYKLLENVFIGRRVRKTGGKGTVAYVNKPVRGVKIVNVHRQGFKLSHKDFPKNIFLDFEQFPFHMIEMSKGGIIDTELTFVESIIGTGTTNMVMISTETLDWLELIDDQKNREEKATFNVKSLNPGDNVISAMYKDGNVMTFLGTFERATKGYNYNYGNWSNNRSKSSYEYFIETIAKRAFFVMFTLAGKATISEYAVSNKFVKQLYRASDVKPEHEMNDNRFYDEDTNNRIIKAWYHGQFDYSSCKAKPEIYEQLTDGLKIEFDWKHQWADGIFVFETDDTTFKSKKEKVALAADWIRRNTTLHNDETWIDHTPV